MYRSLRVVTFYIMKTNKRNLYLELFPRRAAMPAPSTLRMQNRHKPLATSSSEGA